jgi:hypothetical protein
MNPPAYLPVLDGELVAVSDDAMWTSSTSANGCL